MEIKISVRSNVLVRFVKFTQVFSTFEVLTDLIQDEYELTYDFEFLVFDLLSQKLWNCFSEKLKIKFEKLK